MMKRLFSLIAILSLVSGIAYAYDADGNINKKREIDGAPASVAYREYQLVRFGENSVNGAALSQGDVVVADCVSDDGITVALIGTTNSIDAVAGVVVSTTIPTSDVVGTNAVIDFGRRNWGYIQKKGLCTKVNMRATGLPAAGGSIVAVSPRDAGIAEFTTSGVVGTHKTLGFAYDAGTAGSANKVYIDL